MYHGPCGEAVTYFGENGEEHNNPSDYFIDVILRTMFSRTTQNQQLQAKIEVRKMLKRAVTMRRADKLSRGVCRVQSKQGTSTRCDKILPTKNRIYQKNELDTQETAVYKHLHFTGVPRALSVTRNSYLFL